MRNIEKKVRKKTEGGRGAQNVKDWSVTYIFFKAFPNHSQAQQLAKYKITNSNQSWLKFTSNTQGKVMTP